MVGRYATPEADITIARHLPPEDDSSQEVSMSFVIPLQADASNLLDQNYDDFFSGPGSVTLSTPAPPRHLTNTQRSARKVPETIQTPGVESSRILGQILTTPRTTKLKAPNNRTELQETHIPSDQLLSPLSPPIKPFTSMGPPPTSITDPGSSRPSGVPSGSDPGANFYDGPKSNTAPSMASIITTKESGTQPGIQSTSTLDPSHHSTNTQISSQLPIPAPQKKDKGPAQSRGNVNAKPNRETSKPRGGGGLDCETTPIQNRVRGGAAKRLKPTLFNRGTGRVKGRIESDPASSKSRSNIAYQTLLPGSEPPDPDSFGGPAEKYGAVTQSLVTTVLPQFESTQSRTSLESGGANLSGSSSSLDPLPVAEDDAGAKVPREATGECKDDDRLRVSQLSPSKTVKGCRDSSGILDWNNDGIRESSAPAPGASLAVSPMRPSRKRVSSAGQESDTEPGRAWPDEWEKRCLITESNTEGEVRGGGEGKEDQQARRVANGEKPGVLLQPSRRKNGVASSSLTLTKRLKARAVRESPRARKLRDKLAGRVGAGGRVGFSENAGASRRTRGVIPGEKGPDRPLLGEVAGPAMPYSGDNRQQQDGAIGRHTGSAVEGPSFRSTLKRSTVPVEFRFQLAARLGTGHGPGTKEKAGPNALKSSSEDGQKTAGSSRKRPRLDESRGDRSGVAGIREPSSSSRLSEAKDDHHDQTGGHAYDWKGTTCSRSNLSSAASMSRSKRAPLIIPEAFTFSTEQRAKERERFDEAVRVKQKEKEERMEEDRAAKAVEEERGIKEMRKRAVPKANSIPEWYATMPKRKAA